MVLHRYHNSEVTPMPEPLRDIMVAAGTTTIETAVALDTISELKPWRWYGGALQQYQTAFLLLMHLYIHPGRKEADRIWACLDYIFDSNKGEQRAVKARKIMSELQQKFAVYQNMRGVRSTVAALKSLGERAGDAYHERHPTPPGSTNTPILEECTNTLDYSRLSSLPAARAGGTPLRLDELAFAGVSNNQTLWALPNSMQSESLENSGYTRYIPGQSNIIPATGQDDLMADIDWDQFDAMFPPELKAELEASAFPFEGTYGQPN